MANMLLKTIGMISFLLIHQLGTFGQAKTEHYTFEKGEVLDILLLSQNPGTEADLKDYFQIAFPVANRMSYQSLPGFKIAKHTQGNFCPGSLILGKWENLEKREAFLDQIVEEVPDFHERRRKIWSYFGLRYFEMQEDLSFQVDRNKYHVTKAFWLAAKDKPASFLQKWEKKMQKMGGKIIVQLQDGKSPFGYQYNPDFFVITEWENEAAFKAFQKSAQQLELDHIEHVNEFVF